jgi:hypothetical protein
LKNHVILLLCLPPLVQDIVEELWSICGNHFLRRKSFIRLGAHFELIVLLPHSLLNLLFSSFPLSIQDPVEMIFPDFQLALRNCWDEPESRGHLKSLSQLERYS